jgi:putative holliday junction resolvase
MMAKTRIASIDYGLKRLGVAISDESKSIATPLGTILSGKTATETIETLLKILKPYQLERIVIGYPIHMNGTVGPLAQEAHKFSVLLQGHVTCEVSLFDERLSSAQAEKSLKECGMTRKKRAKVVDSVAAVFILQSYLGY